MVWNAESSVRTEIQKKIDWKTYQGASTIMCKAFSWKHSKISMLEIEVIPHSCIPKVQIGFNIVLYEKYVESFDLCSSSQYILVTVIPSCFPFMKMCLYQVSL
jgi:hypothetical protein